jgi:hypothetical protein
VSVISGPLPADIDPSEPISPELVLVSPELRELALACARTFPTAQSVRTQPTPPLGPEPLRVAPAAPLAHSLPTLPAPAEPEPREVAPTSWTAQQLPTMPAPLREPLPGDEVVARSNRRIKIALAAAALIIVTIIAAGPGLTRQRPTLVQSERRQSTAGLTTHPQRERRTKARASATRKRSARSSPSPTSRASPPAGRVSTAPRPGPGTSRLERQAERNVLKSPGFFLEHAGSGAALVDPATKLFHVNTTIKCSATAPGQRVLVCRARRGRISVRLRYIVTGRKSFRLAPA